MALMGATTAVGFDSYHSSTNYCGPKIEAYNRTLPNPVPNQPIPGVNFNSACYEHDKCYGTCSSMCMDKAACDSDFYNRMKQHCRDRTLVLQPACYDLAQVYYRAVQTAGGISYHCGNPACSTNYTNPMGSPNADKAFFFENSNYGGASTEWSKGTEVNDLTKWNTPTGAKWNDRISSIKVGSGARVLIFEHINFGGRCMALSSGRDYPNMTSEKTGLSGSANWNDRISSLKVVAPNQACP
ncbi:MAG: phospholipase A2 [Gallionellaceae bacterium]|nr:phospholipase A2 [Gallionellaceae bacterium]